jgi:hypothetical protein
MTIINTRWPRDICPDACTFTRSRNDIIQESVRTRQTTVLTMGRALWGAQLSWSLPNSDKLAKLRYYLESINGYRGSVQLWDFNQPYPWGLSLGTTSMIGSTNILWSYNGVRSPWNFAGFPSHWALDSYVTLSASPALGATSISISGADASKVLCVQGQYIQVGRRLYMAAASVTADGSGNATITLVSGLLAAATSGDQVRLVEAACEMRLLDQNYQESGVAGQGMVKISASFLETVADFS